MVKITATEFRQKLFPSLDRVLHGGSVVVMYKGVAVKLSPETGNSKLGRLKKQDTILCDPDSLIHSDAEMLSGMENEWEQDWKQL